MKYFNWNDIKRKVINKLAGWGGELLAILLVILFILVIALVPTAVIVGCFKFIFWCLGVV